jgi:hypothetical protein
VSVAAWVFAAVSVAAAGASLLVAAAGLKAVYDSLERERQRESLRRGYEDFE